MTTVRQTQFQAVVEIAKRRASQLAVVLVGAEARTRPAMAAVESSRVKATVEILN